MWSFVLFPNLLKAFSSHGLKLVLLHLPQESSLSFFYTKDRVAGNSAGILCLKPLSYNNMYLALVAFLQLYRCQGLSLHTSTVRTVGGAARS